jgi:hypothetical protein
LSKTPTNYVAKLGSKIVKDGKLKGLKFYDYHVLMQTITTPLTPYIDARKDMKVPYQLKTSSV